MAITNILATSAEIRVHLSDDALIACELKRVWGKSTVARKARFEFEAGERAGAMDALAGWIATAPARRSIVWIVGPAEAQYFVLPWSPAYADRILRDAYARERFEQLYAKDASLSKFCFTEQSAGKDQMVSCISNELHSELVAHAELAGCEIAGIKPSISMVLDRFRDVLETEQGTLCVVDGDRQALVRHNRRRVEHIVVKPRNEMPTLPAARHGVTRFFSNAPATEPTANAAAKLNLPTRRGYVAAQDAAYSFALCGPL